MSEGFLVNIEVTRASPALTARVVPIEPKLKPPAAPS